jgi:hypothetical protein
VTNVLEQAINLQRWWSWPPRSSGPRLASRATRCSRQTWSPDRELRARIIGEWLKTEAHYLA